MILRSTNISDLPSNIWIATAGTQGMTCAAQTDGSSSSSIGTKSVAGAGGTGSAGNKLRLSSPLGGTVMLQIEPGSQAGWVKVSLASAGEGWLGFGVADPGKLRAALKEPARPAATVSVQPPAGSCGSKHVPGVHQDCCCPVVPGVHQDCT